LEQLGDLFLSVGAPVLHAAGRFLKLAPAMQTAIRERLAENHRLLRQTLPHPSALEVLRTEGGWYTVVRCPQVHGSEEWALAFLDSDDTLVHPGYLFDFPGEAYLVLSLLTPSDVFARGIERMSLRVAVTVAAI
jgi:DNA-binding transcriptional MocR family regulator